MIEKPFDPCYNFNMKENGGFILLLTRFVEGRFSRNRPQERRRLPWPGSSLAGFTLIELMVVIIIISILAGVSVVSYSNTKEKSLDKEATSALVLIRNAERQYFARFERFWPSGTTVTTIAQINGNLTIDLSAANWAFGVTGGAAGITYNASATRAGRTWRISGLTGNPTCSGTCF